MDTTFLLLMCLLAFFGVGFMTFMVLTLKLKNKISLPPAWLEAGYFDNDEARSEIVQAQISTKDHKVWEPIQINKPLKNPYKQEKKTSIEQIDKFIDSMNIQLFHDFRECFLMVHMSLHNIFLEEAKKRDDWKGRLTRYRGFLLVFESDIPEGLFYISSISAKIDELKYVRDYDPKSFNLKYKDLLRYLEYNRFKY